MALLVLCIPHVLAEDGSGGLDDPEVGQCSEISTIPLDSRCSYLKQNCLEDIHSDAKEGLRYLSLLYCKFLLLGSAAIWPIIFFLVLCFTYVGTIASDYLCPNLYTISKISRLSDRLTGLTFLALGNGAPDVLGTYKAMTMNSSSLAVSELIGAAFFATTVVIGSMAIIHPFKVKREMFVIDFAFFLIASMLISYAVVQSTLSVWTNIALGLVYVLYVTVLMILHTVWKARAERQFRERRARSDHDYNDELEELTADEIFLDTFATLPSIEELILHEGHSMDHADGNNMTLETGSYGLKVLLKDLSKHSRTSHHGSISLDDNYERSLAAHSSEADNVSLNINVMGAATPHTPEPSVEHSLSMFSSDGTEFPLAPRQPYSGLSALLYTEKFLPDTEGYWEMTFGQKCHFYISYPIVILLNLTVPTVEFTELQLFQRGTEVADDDAFLSVVQCYSAFNFIAYIFNRSLAHFWLVTIGLFILSTGAAAVATRFSASSTTSGRYIKTVSPLFGFVSAICWIALFATEIISIFQAIATHFNLSDDILGLTVYAWGNSVGDLISNFTIARMGLPLMALGACFGAPLLSLCLLGVSAITVKMQLENSPFFLNYDIDTTFTVKIMALSVVMNIIMMFGLVRLNNWKLDRKIGVALLLVWVVVVTICIMMEIYK